MKYPSIVNILDNKSRILILGHADPDGDAIGAMAAIALFLQEEGKEAVAVYEGQLRESIDSLSPTNILTTDWPQSFKPQVIITLDASDMTQLGDVIQSRIAGLSDILWINIDHHVSNQGYGTLNIIDHQASSTCEIVAQILFDTGKLISPKIAAFLLAGIIADTGRFLYNNTNAQTLYIAARLMESEANLVQINQGLESRITPEGVHLWGKVMQNAQLAFSGQVIWSSITENMFSSAEDAPLIKRGMISFLRRTKNCRLAILFVEKEPGIVNINLRSYDDIDCSAIAEHFDGGGHPGAAGGRIAGNMIEAQSRVLKYLEETVFV